MKINNIYRLAFFTILVLPLLIVSPWFFPADWGKTIVFRSIMAVLLLATGLQYAYKKQTPNLQDLKKNIILWVLGALFFIFLVASIFSVDPYFSFWGSPARSGGFINFAFYIIFAVFTFLLFKKEDWARTWNISIGVGVLVCFVALVQYYGLFSNIFLAVTSRPPSTMGNPILLAIYLLLLFFITASLAIKQKVLWQKIGYGIILLLFFYVILLTGSRAAYLGMLLGGIYFFLRYPVSDITNIKKIRILKIITVILLLAAVGFVIWVNTIKQYPQFLQKNRTFESITSRLLLKNFIEDSRFEALKIEFQSVAARPLLGYGPENFSVGFDQHYDPNIAPSLTGIISWWDRAHNIITQTASDAGILGLIAYLALFITLFWQLHKIKNTKPRTENTLAAHAIEATLIAYFAANLFSFDSFSTYLVFFLLVGYTMHLARKNNDMTSLKIPGAKIIFAFFAILFVWFLWQYNIVPLSVNAKINEARNLVNQKNCGQGLAVMEKALPQHSFLDSYARLTYVDLVKNCSDMYPQNDLLYKKRGLEIINEAVKIQPLYVRYWIFLGTTTNDMASLETNPTVKNGLINQANEYLIKALQIAPKHQEIIAQQARTAIIASDFAKAQQIAKDCISVYANFGECYFYLGLSQIYTKDLDNAQRNLDLAKRDYSTESKSSLEQLSNAYGSIKDYQHLVLVYEKLTNLNPEFAQYHSSLAFFYQQVGRYAEAKREALKVLELSPESKPNVDAFLKTLP